jgi:hypothetical protein
VERDAKTHAIIGAALEAHRALGSGFLEAVYQEALAKELGFRNIPYLKASGLRVALLFNFGAPSLPQKRFVSGPGHSV